MKPEIEGKAGQMTLTLTIKEEQYAGAKVFAIIGHFYPEDLGAQIAVLQNRDAAAYIAKCVNAHEQMLGALKATLERARNGYSADKDLLAKAIACAEAAL